jgi:methionyl aminopeptidase
MGWSWPSNADDVLALAHGDVRRLRALFRARRTGEFDPMAPPALADLPLAAAELIHRDFSPDAWEAAATVAAGAPPMRGEGGVLAWLLAAEYARGDVADFSWAVRMLRENESELYSGVGRRRAERRRRGSNSERSPMSIESQDDLDGLRRAGRIVRICIERMKKAVRPGVTTAELDRIGGAALREYGARSAPKLVYNFPADMLISVNDEAVHGVPGPRRLRDGDLVKLDVTVEKDGYMADAAVTVPVGRVTEQRRRMIAAARAGFERAMKVAVAGYRVRDIGRAIETEVASRGFRVVREFQGHGIGRTIHEPPSVPSHFDARFTQQLTEGLVIAVEPIVTEHSPRTVVGDDGWTVRTADGGFTAHYEHTIVVTRGRPILLTAA